MICARFSFCIQNEKAAKKRRKILVAKGNFLRFYRMRNLYYNFINIKSEENALLWKNE